VKLSAAVVALALAGLACAHMPPGAQVAPTVADSVTTALWHMDETGGTKAADSGPFRLDATAGLDTRTDFGRDRNGRVFARTANSFLYIPWNPVMESGGALTIEAWVNPTSYTTYEDTPIAARWTPNANEQSWIFSLVGRGVQNAVSPSFHQSLIQAGSRGALMFAYQPDIASPAQAFFSSRTIPLNHWTHVAATFDGQVVRFYIDGLIDAQFASLGHIRHSEAPLLIGNFFDPHGLTNFGGNLRTTTTLDDTAPYAFEGMMDELRFSSAARTQFSVGAAH
jgi:Concanavalin A-like lectin/glucanases superfamily